MNTQQIYSVIRKDKTSKDQCRGVYASNKLPMYRMKRPFFVIANTDPHNKPGKHWVACYFPKRGKAEFFDSEGNVPSKQHRHFTKFLKKHSKQGYVYNKQRIQGITSKTCGPYAIHYVMHRANGVQRNKILSHFSKDDLVQNDKNVNEWIQMMYEL